MEYVVEYLLHISDLTQEIVLYLILGYILKRLIHIVIGINETVNRCIIITSYEPDPDMWDETYKFKIK